MNKRLVIGITLGVVLLLTVIISIYMGLNKVVEDTVDLGERAERDGMRTYTYSSYDTYSMDLDKAVVEVKSILRRGVQEDAVGIIGLELEIENLTNEELEYDLSKVRLDTKLTEGKKERHTPTEEFGLQKLYGWDPVEYLKDKIILPPNQVTSVRIVWDITGDSAVMDSIDTFTITYPNLKGRDKVRLHYELEI